MTLAKVSRRLLPFLFTLYIACFLDRVNVGFAALQMNRDLAFSSAVYGFGAGVFFLGYSLFELPSNLVLARVGARLWIARIMVTWGVLASAMIFVRGPLSFYTLRFLLGAAEAGFFPGILYYLCGWFPPAQRAQAVAQFMLAIPISNALGGPVSGALLGLSGHLGLAGWQWLFLLEGLPSVFLGIFVLRFLTDHPQDAQWLEPRERDWLTNQVRRERERCEATHGLDLRAALSNRVVWQLSLLELLVITLTTYSLGLWLAQIVKAFSGLSDAMVGVVTAVPYTAAAVAMVLVSAYSDRRGERLLFIAGSAVVCALGYFGSAAFQSPVLLVASLSLAAAGALAVVGPFWTLPSSFLHGRAAAGAIALINSAANLGGFFGPYAIGLLKQSSGDFRSGFVLLGVGSLAGAVLALHLRRSPLLARTAPRIELSSA